jgi:hypothetical protein
MYSLDFWLAVAILAVVPFWMAAYGGHVAAESISDSKHRLSVRLKFWGIGLIGLIVAFAYQYRVTKSDESRQQVTQTWQKSVTAQLNAIRNNPVSSNEQKQTATKIQNQVDRGPKPSAAQTELIKELDSLILSRDESTLRSAFGFPKMMENNIRMNIAIIRHFKEHQSETLDLRPYLGTDWNVDSELAEGHIRRFGGGFQYDPPDGKRVYLLALPSEYTVGKKVLFKFENSSELPTPVVKTIKDLDDTVYKNADKLLHVLNDAAKKDPDYYLRYDDQTSPQYFHQIDAMWLDNFIQLRPKADNIKDAIRQFLGVK